MASVLLNYFRWCMDTSWNLWNRIFQSELLDTERGQMKDIFERDSDFCLCLISNLKNKIKKSLNMNVNANTGI